MSTVTALLARYIATWNETDPAARRRAITELWTEDGVYTDPLASVTGHESISAVIGAAQEMFAGHVFRLLDGAEAHHDVVRFRWELVPAGGGESVAIGLDVAALAADGRIRLIHGFLDKAPAA
ncbi:MULTISPECIES: nuclear transport factor 2 family protein [Actinoalloteichus]|uniref:SnoaL-like domain n=1 Tax=Actinoalloteichus fjordicus TaxID=1612552 RepID=A0AAC9LDF1_9PSEU|nr:MULTISPECIES: nuclear transport factor 2 family protein [Actinoalloteichus]APU15808.1 SnoaL-like domain [Actinoalloteichus fjordicus]APU21868.1 SnoaL-like domain [Actinoalloteichus sp. GBA129-24]